MTAGHGFFFADILRIVKPTPLPVAGRSFSIPETQMEAVYALWDELDRIPVGETDRALPLLARGLAKLLAADNVKWMAAVRVRRGAEVETDSLMGWRVCASYDLVPESEDYRKLIAPIYRARQLDPAFLIGDATHALIAGCGTFRVHRLRDGWIPFRAFSRSEHYRLHYIALGITDRIWVSFPVSAHTESVFLIDRTRHGHFQKKDAVLAGVVLRGIRGFHRRLLLNHGLHIAKKPLSPTAQRIVKQLLAGMSEKEIAVSMGQAMATTHKHITTIYAQFGVRSRGKLMSLWLGA